MKTLSILMIFTFIFVANLSAQEPEQDNKQSVMNEPQSPYSMHITEISKDGKTLKTSNNLEWTVNNYKSGPYRVLTGWHEGDHVTYIRAPMYGGEFYLDGLHNRTLGGTPGQNSVVAEHKNLSTHEIEQLMTIVSIDENFLVDASDGSHWQLEPYSFLQWLFGVPTPKTGQHIMILQSDQPGQFTHVFNFYEKQPKGNYYHERRWAKLLSLPNDK